MAEGRYNFASDNTAGAAPEALEALLEFNGGPASGYGADHVSAQAADAVRGFLDADADVRFVGSGTAANAIALATLCRPFESVLAHRDAHVCTDETGAPGFFGHGLGLIPIDGASGCIDPANLDAALAVPDASYRQSPAALTLTNATEYGTTYTVQSIQALTDRAKARGLPVHLDGARLANALAGGLAPTTLKDLGIDILVIGGTKNGMTPTEALVLFNKDLSRRFDARLKQAGQLPSKGRFYSAPWIGMLRDGAFLRYAAHANAMAQRLAAGMPFPVRHPVQANGVFVDMDEPTLQRLMAQGWFVYRFTDGTVRFMCSWTTSEAEVDALLESLNAIT